MARDCRKKTEYTCSTNKQVDDQGPGMGKCNGKQDKGKGKGTPGRGKGKNKQSKGRSKLHGKIEQKGFHEMEGHGETQDTQANTIQNGRTQVGIPLTTGTTQFGGQTNGALLCGMTSHGNQATKHLQVSQSVQERPDPTHDGSISMFGVLTMCEWSVGDERQHIFNWVQFEMMDGHEIWDTMD